MFIKKTCLQIMNKRFYLNKDKKKRYSKNDVFSFKRKAKIYLLRYKIEKNAFFLKKSPQKICVYKKNTISLHHKTMAKRLPLQI